MSIFDSDTNTDNLAGSESLDALVDLHTISVDTLRGFQKMAEKAEPAFRPVVDRFSQLHIRHVERLDKMAREMGGVPDGNGSYMANVNRAVITLRAVFDAIDADVMDNVRSGEDLVLAAFDRSLRAGLKKSDLHAITKMRAELSTLLDDTRQLG
jgi:uncharacterized protein (TIGR02284 family)